MTRLMTATAANILVLTSPVWAITAEIDLDGDGAYSLTEVQTAMPETTADEFLLMDSNGDGLLDAEEVATAIEAGLMLDPAG